MSLRKYQIEALAACQSALANGTRKGLIVLPTGSGKTVILSKLPDTLGLPHNKRMLVLVHRDELVFQTVEKLHKYNPERTVGVEKAEFTCSPTDNLVVASVQTIGRNKYDKASGTYKWCDRIQKLDPFDFAVIVIDEAHHSIGDSYKSVLAWFRCLKGTPFNDGKAFLLGVTATPERGDNQGLEAIFDRIIYNKPLVEMIEEGWLTDIRAYRVDTQVDISQVKTERGDFVVRQLERTVNTKERNELIVQKYRELGENRRGVVFTVDIQHSVDVAAAFNEAGIRAYALSGNTPDKERRQVLQLFRDGYYRVLASCGILNEGWDDPGVGVGMMARPTKSGLLYRQQIGRVLRPFPSPEEVAALKARGETPPVVKKDAIIIDFCDLSGRHALHTVPTLFGLNPKMNLKGKAASETAKEINRIIEQKRLPISPESVVSLESLKATASRVDLLAKPHIPEHVRKISQYSWVQAGASDVYCLPLPDYSILRVERNMLNQYDVNKSVRGLKTLLGTFPTLESAIQFADSHIPADARYLMHGAASWRTKPVTDAQIEYLWKIDYQARKVCSDRQMFAALIRKNYPTAGQASDRISELNARR